MAEEDAEEADAPKKRSKLPLLIGVVLALALGGGGFWAAYSGMLPIGAETAEKGSGGKEGDTSKDAKAKADMPAFVPIDPIIVTLGPAAQGRHLRFQAHIEAYPGHQSEISALMPRLLDVLNGYLRAVPVAELQDPSALVRLRAQMLRRIQLVAGDGSVRDLLVTEFVLN